MTAYVFVGACRGTAPASAVGDAPEREVREYVQLVVALGARDPDSLDYTYAPREWMADNASNPPALPEIRARALASADRLDHVASAAPDAERWRHLIGQLRAVAARAELLLGRRLRFAEESRALFGVTAPRPDEAMVASTQAALARLLPGSGPLVERYEAFERRHVVPPDRVRAVFERALAGCRERTLNHLSLPPGEQVEVAYTRDSPWNGYSRYKGGYHSTVEVNLDFGLTVDDALALACHEGYPGHHAHNSLVESRLVATRHFMEFTVQPLFSEQMLVAEGLADRAIDLAFPSDDRAGFERDVLYPAAGLDARDAARVVQIERLVVRLRPAVADVARQYLDGDLEFVRAGTALRERALIPQPDGLLKFLNEFRSYAVTYTYGPEGLGTEIGAAPDDPRAAWRRYEEIAVPPWHLPVR
ncbi:MAG: hypothetical protein HY047_18575 [Acidobacteria bacterium]|nr:hypothetical protein [Acidobacteriota bacterium]